MSELNIYQNEIYVFVLVLFVFISVMPKKESNMFLSVTDQVERYNMER